MHNRLYQYLTKNKIIIYSKQFGFQMGYLTEYAIVEFPGPILESFEDNKCTFGGVFINLSTKAFDTVDHSILFEKPQLYGMMRKIQN